MQRGRDAPQDGDVPPSPVKHVADPHDGGGGWAPRVLCCILYEVILPGTKTHGQKLKAPLGPWHARAHHRGYKGFFAEVTMPGTAKRLIEVVSSQCGKDHDRSILRGW